MWQEGYKERYECPVCEIPVTEENYDWIEGKCKQCSITEKVKNKEIIDNSDKSQILEWKEKAQKYDELQNWWWWLQRRTHEGITPTTIIRAYLNSIKEYFEPYKED